jgi:hypothetical protein
VHLNKELMTLLRWSVMGILVAYFSLSALTPVYLPKGQTNENYTYYGVVPAKIYRYILNDWNASPPNAWQDLSSGWILGTVASNQLGGSAALNGVTAPGGLQVATKSLLAVVAAEDDTNVAVYNLTLGSWTQVWAGSLNSMKKQLVLLDNGTTFKVVSDKIVSVLLLNYQIFPSAGVTQGPTPQTFYPDISGSYVGKEFVLMASENPTGEVKGQGYGTYYAVLALESSKITVTSEDGTVLWTGSLDANGYKYLPAFTPFKVYKIESTGNIVVQSGIIAGIAGSSISDYAVPSVEGGFVGEHFFAISLKNPEWGWDKGMDYGYRISASIPSTEEAHVTVYDLDTQQAMYTLTIVGGTGTTVQPDAYAIRVDSDQPVTMALIHNGSIEETPTGSGDKYMAYPNGVMFVGIQPNQETMIQLPTLGHDEAYFFANSQTQLTIDGATFTIMAGSSYFYNQPGIHTVEADNKVTLQVNSWPTTPDIPEQGLWYTGAAIPCIETVNVSATVTLTPIGGGSPMMYVIVGAGAAAVAVVVGVLVMRRRGGKPA